MDWIRISMWSFMGLLLKKKNLWWKLLSWGNSPSSAQHQEKVIHLNWSWDPATTSWNRSTSFPLFLGGEKTQGFALTQQRRGAEVAQMWGCISVPVRGMSCLCRECWSSATPELPRGPLCAHSHHALKHRSNTFSDLWIFYFISASLTATINQAVRPLSCPNVL